MIMRWLRRLHLFSGLFMLPWVFLYGFTALLFNHSTWLSETAQEWVEVEDQATSSIRPANSMAEEICDALSAQGVDIQPIKGRSAEYTSPFIAVSEGPDRVTYFVLDIEGERAYQWSHSKSSPAPKVPVADVSEALRSGGAELQLSSTEELLGESFRAHLAREGMSLSSLPKVEFTATLEGEPTLLRFSPTSPVEGRTGLQGKVSVVGSEAKDLSTRDFLIQLHEAHGYGIMKDARHFWAYSVDLMFLSMTFWGISGLFMWWQLKSMRRAGAITLLLSTATAAALAYGMHAQLVYG